MQPGVPAETALRVYKRYLRLEPLHAEEYIAYLKSKACCPLPRWASACIREPGHGVCRLPTQHPLEPPNKGRLMRRLGT